MWEWNYSEGGVEKGYLNMMTLNLIDKSSNFAVDNGNHLCEIDPVLF